MVFGHEGAGVVEAVGAGVTSVRPGDHVVLSPDSCGTCSECYRGHPFRCHSGVRRNFSGARRDGTTALRAGDTPVHSHFMGQSSFSSHALAGIRTVTVVDRELDFELAPAFACGVSTGAGTVLFGLQPEAGSSIGVFGTGNVGLAAIMAARVAGCTTIVAVDRDPRRLELAQELGATHVIESDGSHLAKQVRSAFKFGFDHAVEATGVPAVSDAAVMSLAAGGVCAQIGVPPAGTTLALDVNHLAQIGVGIRGFPWGGQVPQVLIPRLVELHRQGRFPVDRIVTKYPFGEIQRAVEDVESGAAIKPILLFDRE
jgi:aryl-alcohol dehydrogenase